MRIGNIGHYIKRIQSCNNNKSTETKLYDISTPTISEYIENRFKPQLRWSRLPPYILTLIRL